MTYRVPHRLAWVVEAGAASEPTRVVIMLLPNGEPMILEGVSALIWLLACETSDVPQALFEIVGRPPDEITAETEAFLADLVGRGVLVPIAEAGQASE